MSLGNARSRRSRIVFNKDIQCQIYPDGRLRFVSLNETDMDNSPESHLLKEVVTTHTERKQVLGLKEKIRNLKAIARHVSI